jgi:uncharacterized membrane protein YfcA
MSQHWLNIRLGLEHVLDWQAYDHILFLMVLVVAYSFAGWKRVLWLVSVFTIGHTLSLILAVFGLVNLSDKYVEVLIPITILITALYNIFTARQKERQKSVTLLYIATASFGIIHGLGFYSSFKMFSSYTENKFLPLMEYALGIEAAVIIVAISVLILAFIFQNILKIARRDWILVISSIVIGVILPILRDNIHLIF